MVSPVIIRANGLVFAVIFTVLLVEVQAVVALVPIT